MQPGWLHLNLLMDFVLTLQGALEVAATCQQRTQLSLQQQATPEAAQQSSRQQPELAKAAGGVLLDTLKADSMDAAMCLLKGDIMPDLGDTDQVCDRWGT